MEVIETRLVADNPRQQIGQPVTRQNHPSVSNSPRTHNISHRKHRSRCDHRAVHIATLRNSNPSPVTVSDLRGNLEVLFCPRLKAGALKLVVSQFGLKFIFKPTSKHCPQEDCEDEQDNHPNPSPCIFNPGVPSKPTQQAKAIQ
jgi:hypothetical protein